MAAILITDAQNYIGTAAERAAMSTTGVKAGATFFETDTKLMYIWGGAAWTIHPTMSDYAGLTVDDNTTLTTILLVDAYEPVTVFDTDMPSVFSSSAHATDNITIGASTDYQVTVHISGFSAGNNLTYEIDTFEIAASGSAVTGATEANPCVLTATAHGFSDGDRVKIAGIGGMTELNGQIYTVANKNDDDFELNDDNGAGINSGGYTTFTTAGTAFLATGIAVAHTHRKFGAASDVGSMSGGGFVALTAGNTLEVHAKNIDDAANITIESASLTMMRV